VAWQKFAIGRRFQHHTVAVHVSDATLASELHDGDTKVVRRTTDKAMGSLRGQRPRSADASIS
jgi:hypothetical protein